MVATATALLMAALLPISGALTDVFGARRMYATGISAYGLAVFPVFALFGTHNLALFAVAMVGVFGIVHAWFYGAQGTLYASLYPTTIRYTGLSTVYQLSGVYASGLTPLILTALIAAGHHTPWLACGDQRRRHPAAAPDVAGARTHIKVDGCVGQSFIRSYATLTSSTTDDVVAHYGVTKAV
jgi:MFS family permease